MRSSLFSEAAQSRVCRSGRRRQFRPLGWLVAEISSRLNARPSRRIPDRSLSRNWLSVCWILFVKMVSKKIPAVDSGIFTVTLNKAANHCKNLTRQLEQTVELSTAHSCEADDFRIEFLPQRMWQGTLNSQHWTELNRQLQIGADDSEFARGTAVVPGKVFVMEICPHAPSVFHDRLIKTIKNAADQCSGTGPGVVWLHFVGLAEQDFQALCEFSLNGPGTGLNAIVAHALDPKATTTDRTHIQLVRFSCDSGRLHRQPILDFEPCVRSGRLPRRAMLRRAEFHGRDLPNTSIFEYAAIQRSDVGFPPVAVTWRACLDFRFGPTPRIC